MEPYHLKSRPAGGASDRFRIDYSAELNPAQLQVVEALDGPVLVIAGAGSGKTRTLIYRVARLIESGVNPNHILLLTFTRRAAQEMIRRAGDLLGADCNQIQGGTFHSSANSILRRYGSAAGLQAGFTILDRSDSEDLINLLRTSSGFSKSDKRFPKKRTITEIFSKAANRMVALEEVLEQDYAHFLSNLPDLENLQRAYRDQKVRQSLLDYDDLLIRLIDLIETQSDVREILVGTYRYIMVDEYQDTNRLQARIVQLLGSSHGNVMAVGDDAQSIYSFRGAHFRNIMDFPSGFPGTKIFKLEENYRSTQPILNLTNEIILGAKKKYSKTLFTSRIGGSAPAVVRAQTENHQSRFVCQKLLELREEGVPLNEIAVLFRSSFHSFDLEIELARHEIPFVKRGGFKFIEAAHVKDSLAHLRVIANPYDAVSWHRALLLIEGIGPKKARTILNAVLDSSDPLARLRQLSETPQGAVHRSLTRLFAAARLPGLSMSDRFDALYDYYFPILRELYDDHPKRMKDLEHLSSISSRYTDLDTFLADVTLEPPDESIAGGVSAGLDERLILSTIHSAKGLEWHTVFLIWTLDGRFPSLYSLSTEEELEEERRLFYVASTRAKQNLFMTYPLNVYDRVAGTVLSRPSRFLEDVSSQCFALWDIVDSEPAEGSAVTEP